MIKKISILDYANRSTEVSIEMDDVLSITLIVLTGDEILYVFNNDGTARRYDSSCDRTRDFFDYEYPVYNRANGLNVLDNELFVKRRTSYDFYYDDELLEKLLNSSLGRTDF